MVKTLQSLKISSILFGLALGSASFALAINLDPSPANAIPVSLNRREKPAPKKTAKIAGLPLAQASVTTKCNSAALSSCKSSNRSTGK